MTRTAAALVGASIDRVDAPLKVAGAAPYPNDVRYADLGYAAVVRSTIAAGRVAAIDTAAANAAPGVLTVLTHRNAPRLSRARPASLGPQSPPPLQDDRIDHDGQYLAVVVAETREQATGAAGLIRVSYAPDQPIIDPEDPRASREDNPWGFDAARGDAYGAFAAAEIRLELHYATQWQTNNPLGLFTTVARWEGDELTVHDCNQHTANTRAQLAEQFDLPQDRVRVITRHLGGGFGSGLRSWPHTTLAAMAARAAGRPVMLELPRPEMFTGTGGRPPTVQRVRLGADRDGRLLAIDHRATYPANVNDAVRYRVAVRGSVAYACPNFASRDTQVRLNTPPTGHMRAPGTAEANFALESAMDELAHRLAIDPVELRVRNYAANDPQTGKPWTTDALRECYRLGAERSGWYNRDPEPGSMRDGRYLIGYGMAGVTFGWTHSPCQASATMHPDGTATIATSGTDIGTGTYTILTQLAADLLGLPADRVRVELGDSRLPEAPQAGGSGLTVAVTSAVHDACVKLRSALREPPRDGEPVTAQGASGPPLNQPVEPAGAFGAKFVAVRIDPDLGELRVTRVVSVIDGGRIMNPKLAANQIAGAVVGGIGMTLMEHTVLDPGAGRIVNANLADDLVPVAADIPDLEVLFVGEPDPANPVGVKGIGEIGLVGIAAATANAVHHATGRRIRSLPIRVEDLLL